MSDNITPEWVESVGFEKLVEKFQAYSKYGMLLANSSYLDITFYVSGSIEFTITDCAYNYVPFPYMDKTKLLKFIEMFGELDTPPAV